MDRTFGGFNTSQDHIEDLTKCMHVHKDAPENATCEDCYQEEQYVRCRHCGLRIKEDLLDWHIQKNHKGGQNGTKR